LLQEFFFLLFLLLPQQAIPVAADVVSATHVSADAVTNTFDDVAGVTFCRRGLI
jgi:hypothetical protein